MINYSAIAKRAKKIIDKVEAKLHSARVHLVKDDTDIKELSGLVIILNRSTSKAYQESNEAESQEADSDITKNV